MNLLDAYDGGYYEPDDDDHWDPDEDFCGLCGGPCEFGEDDEEDENSCE